MGWQGGKRNREGEECRSFWGGGGGGGRGGGGAPKDRQGGREEEEKKSACTQRSGRNGQRFQCTHLDVTKPRVADPLLQELHSMLLHVNANEVALREEGSEGQHQVPTAAAKVHYSAAAWQRGLLLPPASEKAAQGRRKARYLWGLKSVRSQ